MKGFLSRILLGNASLKLLALALALLLFALVRSEKESLAQGTVQLSFSPPPRMIVSSKIPEHLRIGVVGPASRMQRFRFEDLAAVHIDLAGVPEGYFEFSKDLVNLPGGFKVAGIRPAGFKVKYMALAEQQLTVKATVQGQVAKGYQVAKQWVLPARVKIIGPKKEVDALTELSTRPVSVEGARADISQQVDLMPLPGNIKIELKGKLKVVVKVEPLTSERVFSRVPVKFEDPAGRPGSPAPAMVEVTVSGPTRLVSSLTADKLSALVQAKETVVGTAKVKPVIQGLPRGVEMLKVKPPTVALTILKRVEEKSPEDEEVKEREPVRRKQRERK